MEQDPTPLVGALRLVVLVASDEVLRLRVMTDNR